MELRVVSEANRVVDLGLSALAVHVDNSVWPHSSWASTVRVRSEYGQDHKGGVERR